MLGRGKRASLDNQDRSASTTCGPLSQMEKTIQPNQENKISTQKKKEKKNTKKKSNNKKKKISNYQRKLIQNWGHLFSSEELMSVEARYDAILDRFFPKSPSDDLSADALAEFFGLREYICTPLVDRFFRLLANTTPASLSVQCVPIESVFACLAILRSRGLESRIVFLYLLHDVDGDGIVSDMDIRNVLRSFLEAAIQRQTCQGFYRRRLVDFYLQHNPEKLLSSLDVILDKYKGREDSLFRKLAKRYCIPGEPPFPSLVFSPKTTLAPSDVANAVNALMETLPSLKSPGELDVVQFFEWMLAFGADDASSSETDDPDQDIFPDLYSPKGLLGALLGKEKQVASDIADGTGCGSKAFNCRLRGLRDSVRNGSRNEFRWKEVLVPSRAKDFESAVGNVLVGWLRVADYIREETNVVVSEVDLNTLRWRKRWCTLSWNGTCYMFEYFTKSPGGVLLGSFSIRRCAEFEIILRPGRVHERTICAGIDKEAASRLLLQSSSNTLDGTPSFTTWVQALRWCSHSLSPKLYSPVVLVAPENKDDENASSLHVIADPVKLIRGKNIVSDQNIVLDPVQSDGKNSKSLKGDELGDNRAKLIAFYQEHNPDKLGDVQTILEKYKGKEHVLFNKLKKQYGLSEKSPRERIVAFYEKHNPNKLSSVDMILEKYKGRFDILFRKLEKQYGEHVH